MAARLGAEHASNPRPVYTCPAAVGRTPAAVAARLAEAPLDRIRPSGSMPTASWMTPGLAPHVAVTITPARATANLANDRRGDSAPATVTGRSTAAAAPPRAPRAVSG